MKKLILLIGLIACFLGLQAQNNGAGNAVVTEPPAVHHGEMAFYSSTTTETVGVTDQYYGIQGEFSLGSFIDGFTFVTGSSGGGDVTTAGTGDSININDATHGLIEGDYINVQSANHEGTVVVTYIDADNIQVKITYVGDETCTWQEGDYLLAGNGTAGTYHIDFGITASAGAAAKEFKFECVQNATHIDNTAFDITTSGTNHQSGSRSALISIAVGDRIWSQFKNQTDTQDLVYRHGGIVLTKL